MSAAKDCLAALVTGHEYDHMEVDQLGDYGHRLELAYREGQVHAVMSEFHFIAGDPQSLERVTLAPEEFEVWFGSLPRWRQGRLANFARWALEPE